MFKAMKTKASIVVMSHLSDAALMVGMRTPGSSLAATIHINFAKLVIFRTGGDLSVDIDPDQLWESFKRTGVLN